jgi:hypothetical protein
VISQDDFRLDANDPGGIHPGQKRISPLTQGISWEQWEAGACTRPAAKTKACRVCSAPTRQARAVSNQGSFASQNYE